MGLSRPQRSDVSELNKAGGSDEEKENEQDTADEDLGTSQPTVKTKRKTNNAFGLTVCDPSVSEMLIRGRLSFSGGRGNKRTP